MAKKRRSREFKNSSQVIDIEEARRKRQEKRKKSRGRVLAAQAAQEAQRHPQSKSAGSGKAGKTLIYLAVILIMLAIAGASVYNIASLKQEQKEVLQEQQRLKAEKNELEEELKHLEDPDYIEEQARAQLRLVMPGESIYVFPKTDRENDAAKGTGQSNEEN